MKGEKNRYGAFQDLESHIREGSTRRRRQKRPKRSGRIQPTGSPSQNSRRSGAYERLRQRQQGSIALSSTGSTSARGALRLVVPINIGVCMREAHWSKTALRRPLTVARSFVVVGWRRTAPIAGPPQTFFQSPSSIGRRKTLGSSYRGRGLLA